MVPSSSEDVSRAVRVQPKWKSWNYLRRNGGKCGEKSLSLSTNVFCALSHLFVRLSFCLLCARLVVHSSRAAINSFGFREFKFPSTLRWRNLNSFIFPHRPGVHTNPSWKRSFSNTLSKPEEFENAGTENNLKTNLFENDEVTIIRISPCTNVTQTQIQNHRWLLRFFNVSGVVWDGKHLIRFQWIKNLRLQIPPA